MHFRNLNISDAETAEQYIGQRVVYFPAGEDISSMSQYLVDAFRPGWLRRVESNRGASIAVIGDEEHDKEVKVPLSNILGVEVPRDHSL